MKNQFKYRLKIFEAQLFPNLVINHMFPPYTKYQIGDSEVSSYLILGH